MELPYNNLNITRKIENALVASVILFIIKITLPSSNNFLILLFTEISVFVVCYFWIIYLKEFLKNRPALPLNLILNLGIIGAQLFFIQVLSASLFDGISYTASSQQFVYIIISYIFVAVVLGSGLYIFAVFRELFYLRQKKDPKLYFHAMTIFIVLTYFSNFLIKIDVNLAFLKNTFYVVSIILMAINSIRIAWIAFLSKKQKLYVLGLSILLSVLFGFCFALSAEDGSLINQIIVDFSPGVHAVFNLMMIYATINFGVIFFTTLFHLPTAEAFDRKAEEVTSLTDFSKLITQVFDFNELLDTVTSITRKVSNSDVAWFALETDGDYEIKSVEGIGFTDADKITHAVLQEKLFNLADVKIINGKSNSDSFTGYSKEFRFESIAVAPVKVHEVIRGYLFAGNYKYYSFDDDDAKTIGAFADYVAVALENSKLIEENIEKERMEKELDVAREIQYKILPSETPDSKELEISALFVPAFEVGGDYYDFFEIDENNLGFVIADVSGKGISASFIMAEVKGIFESLAQTYFNPKEILVRVNSILKNSLQKKDFVTAVYGIINKSTGKVQFSRAGHSPVLHFCSDGIKTYIPKGLGLGLEHTDKYEMKINQMEIELKNDDILILFTDGVTESQNIDGESFGLDKLKDLISANSNKSLDELSGTVMQELTMFSKDNNQHDDITLVLFRWNNNKIVKG